MLISQHSIIRENIMSRAPTITDSKNFRRMAMAGALAAMYPYAENSGFMKQQQGFSYGAFNAQSDPNEKAYSTNTRKFFIYCCTVPNGKGATVETAIKFDQPIYRIDIDKYPFVLFDNDQDKLKSRAQELQNTLKIEPTQIYHYPQPPAQSARDITPSGKENWATVLHEIKLAEIGDEAVRKLLNNEITPDMAAFLSNASASEKTRGVLGIATTPVHSGTNQQGLKIPDLKEIIDHAHQVAFAASVTVALDHNFSPLTKPESLTIINGFMPRLGSGPSDGYDLKNYVENGKLKATELKKAYCDAISTQMKAAQAAEKIGLVIVPPSAFLAGLDASSKAQAKKLWFEAADDAAKSHTNFTLVVIGAAADQTHSFQAPQNVDDAVDYAITNNFACAIGGHPTQPEGNGARSSGAAQAFEENLYRRCTLDSLGAVRGGEPFKRQSVTAGTSSQAGQSAAAAPANSSPQQQQQQQQPQSQQPAPSLKNVPSWLKGLTTQCTIKTSFNLDEEKLKTALITFKDRLEDSKLGFNFKNIEASINNNIISYKGEQNGKPFEAELKIEPQQNKNETTFTCSSKNLDYAKQLELIATQAVTAQLAADPKKTTAEIATISIRSSLNNQSMKLKAIDSTPSAANNKTKDVDLHPDEHTFITACFKAGATEVKYNGNVFLNKDNPLIKNAGAGAGASTTLSHINLPPQPPGSSSQPKQPAETGQNAPQTAPLLNKGPELISTRHKLI